MANYISTSPLLLATSIQLFFHLNNNIVEAGALVLSYCLVKRMCPRLVQYNITQAVQGQILL